MVAAGSVVAALAAAAADVFVIDRAHAGSLAEYPTAAAAAADATPAAAAVTSDVAPVPAADADAAVDALAEQDTQVSALVLVRALPA